MHKLFILFCLTVLLGGSYAIPAVVEAAPPQAQQPAAEARKVDLNTADQQQLEELPGIGPRTAERIIQFREENGPFRRIEDLLNVRGIGEKKFQRLKDLVRVGSGEPPAGDS